MENAKIVEKNKVENMELNSPEEYYVYLLKEALTGRLSYDAIKTKDGLANDMIDVNISYDKNFNDYTPSFACFHDWIEEGYGVGLYLTDGKEFFTEYAQEICDILIQLINKKGFDCKSRNVSNH